MLLSGGYPFVKTGAVPINFRISGSSQFRDY